jgi:hypothetical protein
MKFGLVRPCGDCPFRSDRKFWLKRAPEIAAAIFQHDQTFVCHNAPSQHCAGALILHEKLGKPNFLIRLAHGCGLYDPAALAMAAPVVDSVAEFIERTLE